MFIHSTRQRSNVMIEKSKYGKLGNLLHAHTCTKMLITLIVVVVSDDCKVMIIEGTSTIAGSCSSMLDIFHNLLNVVQVPVSEAVAMLSENPARYDTEK